MNSMFTKFVRRILGCILIIFGLNILWPQPFIPLPVPPEKAAAFLASLAATGYILKTVALLEIVIGLLLLTKKWVAFALILLAPISLNILLFHFFLDASGVGGALVVAALNGILIYKYWSSYRSLFHY
ncbi:MAG: hypothetical protein RIQ59_2058 [Bacteroidota bacterium]|jgi:hypothetical protein